jgi:hypothetical protein
MEEVEKSSSGPDDLYASSGWQPKGWLQWFLVVAIIFVFVYFLRSFMSWTYDEIGHSRWWLGLSPLRRHLLLGVVLTGFGSIWLRSEIRDLEDSRYPHRVLYAALTTIWGLYELFEAAWLS